MFRVCIMSFILAGILFPSTCQCNLLFACLYPRNFGFDCFAMPEIICLIEIEKAFKR